MRFEKWHGIGNDYILIDASEWHGAPDSSASQLCDRHFGIGGDGILVIGDVNADVVSVRIINPDGSLAEMCGNGMRMVARYVAERRSEPSPDSIVIETAQGRRVSATFDGDDVCVDMGDVSVGASEAITAGDHTWTGRSVDVGNPHFVIAHDPAGLDLETLGPPLEHHERFPHRTNVEMYSIDAASHEVSMRVWERGVGETLACGSGACAVGVVAMQDGNIASPVTVHLPGGTLKIGVVGTSVTMTGPAERIFSGSVQLPQSNSSRLDQQASTSEGVLA